MYQFRATLILMILPMLWLGAPQSAEALVCTQLFTNHARVMATEIRFSQRVIGYAWGAYKAKRLKKKYRAWKKTNPEGEMRAFLTEYNQRKPFPVIIDGNGIYRIIDNHHRFYAMTHLYGQSLDFHLSARVVMDYRYPRPTSSGLRVWTPGEMIQDMMDQGYIGPRQGEPGPNWLNSLPTVITELEDSPERSLFSFVFLNFEVEMEGDDFLPHIQNRLALRMHEMEMDPLGEGDPFKKRNLKRVIQIILNHPELVNFMIENVNPESDRSEKILEFFENHRA
jgi:hypothetical protein